MAEVTHMSRHELDMLTESLAACESAGLEPDDKLRQPCDIAENRYRIAYLSGRPIDKIFLAKVLIERQIAYLPRNLKQSDPRSVQANKDLFRLSDVQSKLSDAIVIRNSDLDSK
jgi:hypothetical protein